VTLPIAWQILYWTWVASEVVIGIATRTRQSTGRVHDRGSLIQIAAVIELKTTTQRRSSEVTPPNLFGGSRSLKLAGVVVLVIALAIRWTAIYTLGKSFSSNVAILDSQSLNRSGLYRYVRHPSYLGLMLVFLSVGLHSRNWLSLAIAVVPTTAALLYRIRVEESALRQAFGDAYVSYSKEVSRLIPGLF